MSEDSSAISDIEEVTETETNERDRGDGTENSTEDESDDDSSSDSDKPEVDRKRHSAHGTGSAPIHRQRTLTLSAGRQRPQSQPTPSLALPRQSAHFRFTGRAGQPWSLNVQPPKTKRRHPWLEGRTGLHQKRLYVPGDAPLDMTRHEAPKIRRSHAWLESRNGLHSAEVYVPGVTPLHSVITNRNIKLTPDGFTTPLSRMSTSVSRTSINTLGSVASSRKTSYDVIKEWDDSIKLPNPLNMLSTLRLTTHSTRNNSNSLRTRFIKKNKDFQVLENLWNDSMKLPHEVVYYKDNVLDMLNHKESNKDSTVLKNRENIKETKRSKDPFKFPNSINGHHHYTRCKFSEVLYLYFLYQPSATKSRLRSSWLSCRTPLPRGTSGLTLGGQPARRGQLWGGGVCPGITLSHDSIM